MDEKKMVILALGDRDKDWIKDARCNEKIVMVDCKSLYDEQVTICNHRIRILC